MRIRSELDAIIIADSGIDSLSGTNPLKLHLNGRVGAIQHINNFIENNGTIVDPVPGDNQLSWSSAPRLNGIHLYNYLTTNEINVELIHNYAAEKIRFKELLNLNPRAVIISTTFIFFKKTLRELAEDIRTLAPDIFIIAGGTFVYSSYLLLKRKADKEYETKAAENDFLFLNINNEPDIDLYIVSSQGDDVLTKSINHLTDGKSFDSIKNTAQLRGNTYIFSPRSNNVLQSLAIDWNILPQSFFKTGVIPLQASNGCPYNCSFCNFTKDRRISYIKPVERLIEEMKAVANRGIKYVWFVDDNFRQGKHDLNNVCKKIIDNNIDLKWMCFIRASTLKNADMTLLKQAGCIEVQIGLESGDPQILTNMNKQTDPVMYKDVIGNVLQHGINVSCYFITGFPGETETTAATTRDFIRSIEYPDAPGSLFWSIYPFMLTPLSPIYEPELRRKFKLKGYLMDWKHETMDFKQAKKLVAKAFFELKNSGPIYREDNLEMLSQMSPKNRKTFFTTRNLLSKKTMQNILKNDEVLTTFKKNLFSD